MQNIANAQQVSCPNCGIPILLDPYALIRGASFACSGCESVISLDPGSHGVVKNALDQLEELKKDLGKD